MKKLSTRGLDKVIKNLNKEIKKIEGRTLKGLIDAAMFIKRETLPVTPYDTGNLRGSCYVLYSGGRDYQTEFKGEKAGEFQKRHLEIIGRRSSISTKGQSPLFVEIGFTANYAIAVHELNRNYKPGTFYKFLETTIRLNQKTILKYIEASAKR